MRNYDLWCRYLDNQGNPLHGCVQFMVKDGTTVAPIFDSDGTAIDNPQLTDIYGRTQHQVFIDEDCVAYFYKYIGDGSWTTQLNIDTSDVTKWVLQYTIENQNTVTMNITSESAICVPTISALRELDIETVPTVGGVKVITLLGYNTLGDKEPINYYWNPTSTELDDDGAIIKYNGEITGRWIMVQPTEHCDSRHYGIFPSNSSNMNDQTYPIIKLFEYCNNNGIKPYFNADGDYIWYKYQNLVVSAPTIDITKGVKFLDLGNSTITGEWSEDPYFNNRNTNVVAENVKTSWNAKTYTGYKNVLIDVETTQKNWQNAYIDSRLNPTYGYNFNHCTFAENRNFGSNNNTSYNTFNDCTLTSKMFIVTGDNATSFATGQATNCEFRQEDWIESEDAFHYYIQLRMTNDTNPCFDYKGMTSGQKPVNNYSARTVAGSVIRLYNYNYTGSNGLIDPCGADALEINNCTGVYSLNNWNSKTVIIKNCRDFTITNVPNNLTLYIEDSVVALNATDTLNNVSIKNSTFVADNSVTLTCNNFTSYSSIITCKINCNACVIKDSQVNAQLVIEFDDSKNSSMYIDNNIFNAVIYFKGKSGATNHVNGVFTNNYSNYANPILVVRDYLDMVEANNHYRYSNNKGHFLPSPEEGYTFNKDIALTGIGPGGVGVDQPDNSMVYRGNSDHDAIHGGLGYIEFEYDNIVHAIDQAHRGISGPLNFFRIGTDSFRVSVNWRVYGSNIQDSIPYWELVVPTEFSMNCVNDNGNWRLDTFTFPNSGYDSNRISINRCGITLRAVVDISTGLTGVVMNCTFTMKTNP